MKTVKSGFTLIEVLIALVILSFALTILSRLTTNTLRRAANSHQLFEHVWRAKQSLHQALAQNFDKDEKSEHIEKPLFGSSPEYVLATTKKPIDAKKSALAPFANKINLITVQTQQKQLGKTSQVTSLTGFALRKEKP